MHPCVLDKCVGLASSPTQRFITRLGHRFDQKKAASWLLARTHKDLVLSHCSKDDSVALCVETSNGLLEELIISSFATEAIAFVAREPIFEVRGLPGNFSEQEETEIAEALEETGLFTRIWQ